MPAPGPPRRSCNSLSRRACRGWAAALVVVSAACLPPIPEVGRGCNDNEDCSKGYFSLVSSNIYCVPDDEVPDGGVCLILPTSPDAGSDDAGVPDAGPDDGGLRDGGDTDGGAPVRNDPYACEGYTPLVRGVVVARQDGATVRQPLAAFGLAAPLTGWTVQAQSTLGEAEVRGADIAFEPAPGAVGTGALIIATDDADALPCAERVIAVRVHVVDTLKFQPLDPVAPGACPSGHCGRVLLTEAQSTLLAGATYDSIAVLSGVTEVRATAPLPGVAAEVTTLAYLGAPLTFAGLDRIRLAEAPIGEAPMIEGHTPLLVVEGGERLVADGWLRVDALSLSAPGAAADAEVTVGVSGWLQSDAPLTALGPTSMEVGGVLAAPAGAALGSAEVDVEGALVAGGVFACESATLSFGAQGQVWAVGTTLLDCTDVALPDVWVTHGARLSLGTPQGLTRFRDEATLSSRGHVSVCRWETVAGDSGPPRVLLDEGATLAVGAPVVTGQHDDLLSNCTVVGDDVDVDPPGACGEPVSFTAPAPLGARGVLVGCVGAAPCPSTSRLREAQLIDAPAGPFHPMVVEVAGGELAGEGGDLAFTRGFVAQRTTAEVLSCTGPSFEVLIDSFDASTATWFWRADAPTDVFVDPNNWLDTDGAPAAAAPPEGPSTRLVILPGSTSPHLSAARSAGHLSVFGDAALTLAAPLTLAGTARVAGQVVATQASGELVLTGATLSDGEHLAAGHIGRLVFEQQSEPRLTSALEVDHLLLRAPDPAPEGLTFVLRSGAHVLVRERLGVASSGIHLQLDGPSDADPTLLVLGTVDLGPVETLAMSDGVEVEVRGGWVCDDGAPASASFTEDDVLRFVGGALQPLSCKSAVGALPPHVRIERRARVQLDGALAGGVGVTRVNNAAPGGSTLVVDGELLFFGPDQTPQQLEGVDAIVVGPEGKLRFPPDDTGFELLGGASCTAATGTFAPGQLEGFDAWCAP